LEEKLRQFSADTVPVPAIPRLGIKAYRYRNEALHGIARNGEATSFPTGLGMGATWNRELVKEAMDATSDEARAYWNTGSTSYGLTYWSPTINMSRDPRWGRAQESFGEDPYLMSEIGGAFVDGLQSDNPTYLKSVATIKHYTANNNDNNRHTDSANMSQKDLREFYLPGFQNATEKHGAASLMTAYSAVNGVPMPANEFLVKDVLRRTWGFDGFVTSDCGAIEDVADTGTSGHAWKPEWQDHVVTRPEATAYSIKAGTDIDCAGAQYTANIGLALNQGLLTEDDVDVALARIFTVRMRTGEFDSHDPWPASVYSVANEISAPDHIATAERMSEEAIVLLKNDPALGESAPILPLPKSADQIDNIVVAGTLADRMVFGNYSATITIDGRPDCEGNTSPCNHPLNGIREAVRALGGDSANVEFVANDNDNTLDATEAALVTQADAVIVVVGTYDGDSVEDGDRTTLNIQRQAALANTVVALNPRTVVYVSSVALVNIEGFRGVVPAVLWSTYNGQRQGTALGRVLWSIDGVNPSAHLPFTWYTNQSDLPGTKDYALAPHDGTKGRTYQYFTGYADGNTGVSYPFGHGLSYSSFSYSGLSLDKTAVTGDETVGASLRVANTSAVPGETVVQLYASSPVADGLTRPLTKLVAFDKISLKAYQVKTVRLEVPVADLWYWDEGASAERTDLGLWTLHAGASVSDAATTATFEVTAERTKTLQQVRTIPSGVVLDLDDPDASIDAGASAAANDQSFYDLESSGVTVAYSSSNPAVARVSRSGEVRGIGDGVATITATITADGTTASDSFAVAVTHSAPQLETLLAGGVPLPDFDPATTSYTYELSSASAVPPALTATAPGLTVTVEDATGPGQSGTVTVTDTMGGSTVYTVRFVYHHPLESIDFRGMTEEQVADANWSFIRPDPAAVSYGANGVTIQSQLGDIYQRAQNSVGSPPNSAKNLLWHDAPGDWTATVDIDAQLPAANFQKIAMLAYGDDDNFVFLAYQYDNGIKMELSVESDGVRGQRTYPAITGVTSVQLRLAKTGNQYWGFYSTDAGNSWLRLSAGPVTLAATDIKLALGNYGQPDSASRSATFKTLTVAAPPPPAIPLESIDFRGMTEEQVADANWSFIRPDPAAVSYGANGVTIQSQIGDLYQRGTTSVGSPPNSAKNLLWHDAPGDWTATVDIDAQTPAANFQKIAMLAYGDDDNFVFLSYQYDGGVKMELSVESNGARGQRYVPAITGVTSIQLRLQKSGNQYQGFYNAGTGWVELSASPVTFAHTDVKLVLGNYGQPTAASRSATFKTLVVEEPAGPPVPTPFETIDFRGKTRDGIVGDAGWSIVRENAGAITYGDADGLMIATETGGLWSALANGKNLFTHSAPGDWTATMHLSVSGFDANYEQAMIGMYEDDGNYIKLTRSAQDGGRVQLAVENSGTGNNGHILLSAFEDLYLRLVKVGDTYHGYFSGDDVTYTRLGSVTKVFADPRFMFATFNDSSNAANAVATFIELDVAPPLEDKVASIDFPSRRVELSDALAGVDLAAAVTVYPPTAVPDVSYGLIPMDVNTAGASVTSDGVLTANQIGKVRVRVTATAGLNTLSKTALITVIPDGTGALTPTLAPALDLGGLVSAHVGEPVALVPGTWSVVPDSVSYQWFSDGVPLAGATGMSYTPVVGDVGHELSVEATAVHEEFGSVPVASTPVEVHGVLEDKSGVDAKIAQAESVLSGADPAGFTQDSWNALEGALATAQVVSHDEDATASEVDDAIAALDSALVLTPRGNVASLQAALGAAGALVQAEYTLSSWAVLASAVDEAQELVDHPENVTVSQVSTALAAVTVAVSHLVAAVSTSGLVSATDGVRAQIAAGILVQTAYTQASWDDLEDALAAADVLIATPGEFQSVVTAAANRVLDAVAGLVALPPAVIVAELENLVALADGMGLVASQYTPTSWAVLTAALGVARTQTVTPTSQTAVDQARAALAAALEGLVADPNVGAPDQLATLVASVTRLGLVPDGYTTASWAALQAALAQAADAVTPAEAAAALVALQDALAALVARVDRAQVVSAVQAAAQIGTTGYTLASAATLASAIAAAQALLAQDPDTITQTQVDDVLAMVSDAVAGLVVAPSDTTPPDPVIVESIAGLRAALTTLIQDVSGLKAGDYTAESWAAVAAALTAASAAAADPQATRVSLEAAVAALSRATVGLKAATPPAVGDKQVETPPAVGDKQAETPPVTTITKVKAAQTRVTLTVGKSVTIPVRAWTDRGTVAKVAWKSSKPSIAKVSATGKIAAKKKGKATITASVGGKTVKITVTVLARSTAKTRVTTTAATGVPKTMTVGQTAWITGKYTPAKAAGIKVKFATSSSATLAIDKTGRLIAKAPGKATITVKAGTKSKKYTVRVTAG
jgi:beta-glucosidase-like glycosyl hydrolase/regulation of enolase protein 1 (concanavalin A-like superfamily)/uncharacterized protein YjdB